MSDTESFEASLCELMGYFYDNSYATRLCERIRRAHDREIRDVSQQQYDRGYIDGTHSMDAEHRAVAMRLRALPMNRVEYDANLYDIIEAVCGTNKAGDVDLRDKLIDLMGGVSDDTCDSQCRGACAADCGRDSGEYEEVSDDCVDCDILGSDARGHAVGRDFQELGVSNGRVADDCGADTDCGDGGGDLHMAGVTYDVLWNERRKAIAELRYIRDCLEGGFTSNTLDIADAIGAKLDVGGHIHESMCDRLIHLLGGDQPSGIDVLRAMDAESDTDGTCPNDVPTSSITEELREWMSTVLTSDDYAWAIADRIDAQFDRICQQHEAVLQSTIDGMVKEYEHDRLPDQLHIEKLEKQRDHWRQQATDMMNHADAMEHECDDLQAKLDEATHDVEMWRDRAEDMRMERDELQAKLDAIRDALDG